MDTLPLYQFNYFSKDDNKWCPKCGEALEKPQRKICKGKLIQFRKKCPGGEHFHISCPSCNAEWCESTVEVNKDQVATSVVSVFKLAAKAGLDEDKILELWRNLMIQSVMEE